jgi:hypothetical protein
MRFFAGAPVHKNKMAYFSVLIDEFVQILLEISIPYWKCEGNSIKFHSPRHWIYFRLQLGCAAAEKTLERKLAETQKKFTVLLMAKEILILKLSKKTCKHGRCATYYMQAVYHQWKIIQTSFV